MHTKFSTVGLTAIAATLSVVSTMHTSATPVLQSSLNASLGSTPYLTKSQPHAASTMQERIARRLQTRIRAKTAGASPSVEQLTAAITNRQNLLKQYVSVQFLGMEGELGVWEASVARYPLWITPDMNLTQPGFSLSKEMIASTLSTEKVIDLPAPTDITLESVQSPEDSGDVYRAVTSGVAKSGYEIDAVSVASTIIEGLGSGAPELPITLHSRGGKISNETGLNLGNLELWATGRSNFKGSDYGRIANVRKALREHVNNTIVPPGETFSFNDTLGGPVSQGRGWNMAKVIFNGGDLELAPGGGICQASTTTYRAALNAGFPVVERAAHSLYVTYYAAYGVGIDATIFPGKQDLKFLNDSGNYLLIQSYDDGYEAYVNIYGTPDGRVSTLEGPYFAANAPEDLTYNGRSIRSNEILWKQKVTYSDGRVIDDVISSQYNKGIPNYVVKEQTQKVLHAAAN